MEGGHQALSSLHTVHVLLGDLPKDLQVGPVEDTAQNIREVPIPGPKKPLRCHPVGNQPHTKEEEEEEHVLHLRGRKRRPSLAPPHPPEPRPARWSPAHPALRTRAHTSLPRPFLPLDTPPIRPRPPHHLVHDDDLGPQLFVDRENVQQS